MGPTIILIRHGEALHNATDKYWTIVDPALTEKGIQQAKDLQERLRKDVSIADEIGLIVISPLKRTIQTAVYGLDWLIKRGIPIRFDADWQENSDHGCDVGSPKEIISKEFPQFDFDDPLNNLPPEYPRKVGPFAFTQKAIEARGARARQWLKNRPEKVVACVSHSAFLRLGISHRKYANADFRIFDFTGNGDEIVEWQSTEQNGGGMGRSQKGIAYAEPGDFDTVALQEEGQSTAEGEIVKELPT